MIKIHSQVKATVLLLFLTGLAYSQVNDRRRLKSDVFNKRQVILSQMEQTVWRSGSWFFSPIINVGQIGYDSNLFSQPEGQENSDFIIAPQLGMKSFFRINPRLILNLEASGQYTWYKDNSSLRGLNPDLQARFYGIFKRLFLEVGSTYVRDFARVNTETVERSENERTAIFLNTMFRVTSRSFLRFDIQAYELKFLLEEDQARLNNRTEDKTSASYIYKKSPRFWPFLELDSKNTEFSGSDLPFDIDDLSVFIGARNDRTGRFHYLGKIGINNQKYTFFSEEGELKEDAEELEYRLFTHYKVTRHFFIEAGVNQNVIYSLLADYSHYLSQRSLLGFGWTFKNGVEVGPDFYLGLNDYKIREGSLLTDINYDYFSSNMNVSFPLLPKVKMQITIGFEDRELPFYTEAVTSWYSFMDIDYRF